MWGVTLKHGLPAMTWTGGDPLLTNVILSLEIPKGAFFADTSFGLRRRTRMKLNERTARLVKGDVEEALKWLLDNGRARAIEVVTEIDTEEHTRLKALISVTAANGRQLSYEKFVEVV
jgi:phage gp46-like protein